jgi:hypothetical protein
VTPEAKELRNFLHLFAMAAERQSDGPQRLSATNANGENCCRDSRRLCALDLVRRDDRNHGLEWVGNGVEANPSIAAHARTWTGGGRAHRDVAGGPGRGAGRGTGREAGLPRSGLSASLGCVAAGATRSGFRPHGRVTNRVRPDPVSW